MASKKITKASKRRLMIFGSLSCLVMAYLLVNLVTYSYQIKKLSDEQTKLTQNLNELREKESNLVKEINKLKDPDYLARYARENYLYTKDGEYVIKEDENKTVKKEKNKDAFGEYKTPIIVGTIILVFMIFYVLKTLVKEGKEEKRNSKKK